ncbi:hypothetical protein [Vibrio sp. Hal054]
MFYSKRERLLKRVQLAIKLGASQSQEYVIRRNHGRQLCLQKLLDK